MHRHGIRVALVYKNFAAHKGVSHIGLGVAAMNTATTLRRHGYHVEVWPVVNGHDIKQKLIGSEITHMVISAAWVQPSDIREMLEAHPYLKIVVNSHSNIGFLMADPGGIRILRETGDLSDEFPNLAVSGNSMRFCWAWGEMYGRKCRPLPNLYDIESFVKPAAVHSHRGRALKIGIFGAIRPLKNMTTACAAAIMVSRELDKHVHTFISTGRDEGGATVQRAMREMSSGLDKFRLLNATWRPHDEFRKTVADMDILLQPSYTESFNMVTADGVAEGVPSVVSNAIDWAPIEWQVDAVDSASLIASRAISILQNRPREIVQGQRALRTYVKWGLTCWEDFLCQ